MDRKYIDRNHIVARYLACQLSGDERKQFEDCYVVRPAIIREMEATAKFKAGLKQLADAGLLEQIIEGTKLTADGERNDSCASGDEAL